MSEQSRPIGRPTGAIGALGPFGRPFGIDWSAINRWDGLVVMVADELQVPESRLKATIVIESSGNPQAIQTNPSNGNSYGLLQIVPHGVGWDGHHRLVNQLGGPGDPRELLTDPAINLRVGATILKSLHRTHQDWDAASSAFFLGNPNWVGGDTVNGTTGAGYKRSLHDLIAEIADSGDLAGPNAPDGPPPPVDPDDRAEAPPMVWVGTDNRHDRRGQRPVAIVHHITDDMSYANVRDWFRNPNSNASAHVVVDRDGTIYQFVGSSQAAWTNGEVRSPRKDIPWLNGAISEVNARRRNLNDYTINIEAIGKPGVEITDAQLASIVKLDRYWTDFYSIPISRGRLMRHSDIDSVNRSYCPSLAFPLARIILTLGGNPADMRT